MMALIMRRALPAAAAGLLSVVLAGCNGPQADRAQSASTDGQLAEGIQSRATTTALVTVYKNPTCECCAKWADHLRESGFRVKIEEGADLNQIRAKSGVPNELASCHTALVDGYAIEGHVPADLIQKLLRDRPRVAGLAVPGMPPGVIGMPDAGPDREKYPILAFAGTGPPRVYAER